MKKRRGRIITSICTLHVNAAVCRRSASRLCWRTGQMKDMQKRLDWFADVPPLLAITADKKQLRCKKSPAGAWSHKQSATGFLKDSFWHFPSLSLWPISSERPVMHRWETRQLVPLLLEENWWFWFQQVFLWSKVTLATIGNIFG